MPPKTKRASELNVAAVEQDLDAAASFLRWLDPDADSWTFQTYDDRGENRKLARVLHGTLDEHAETLIDLNRRGAAITVTMNETDLQGTKRENIRRVRGLVADLDDAPIEPVLACQLPPQLAVESSPGRHHVYWQVDDNFPLDEFEDTQRAIAKTFDGDPAVALSTHRARLPGFFHMKRSPFMVRVVSERTHIPFDSDTIQAEFPPVVEPHKASRSATGALILPAGAPTEAADKFVQHCATRGQLPLLRHYRGAFYLWDETHYRLHREEALERDLYKFLKGAMVRKENGNIVPFNPTKSKVAEVVHALRRSALLVPEEWEVPCWLGVPGERQEYKPATDLISCGNGILNLKTRELLPHDPLFFTPNALTFDYDPNAPKPKRFFRFLDALRLDEEMEDTLKEIFGYLLTSDTQQQKIFLIVGPRRGGKGKGTLVFVLEHLLGTDNIVFQTLDSLTGEFGRWPLIDKKLAVFADARLGSRGNIHRLVETLLSISGGDPQTINRKYGPFWTGRLLVRFLITTNVLPALKDASGTIASRFIMLKLTESFYGREDMNLKNKLLPEMPGILNWALDGLAQLRDYGHFQQPTSSKQAIQLLEHLAAPVQAFVSDWCETGPDKQITVKRLYQVYRDWADDAGQKALARNMFGKELRDVVPTLDTTQSGARRTYVGVGLSEMGEAAWEDLQAEKGKTRS
jgi:putative DNA primase/helicase